MPAHHHRRETCRLCGSRSLTLVVPLPATPVADAYVTAAAKDQPQDAYPLDLYQCGGCGHVQLCDVVDPEVIFRNYSYFSGRSPGLVRHFEEYATDLLQRTHPPTGSLVVDIGSNDGCFLQLFRDRGLTVLGIDPAENVAATANAAGIETWPVFFHQETADRIRRERGRATIVTANNVYAHTDDLAGMTDAIASLLADDGVFAFEVSYLLDVIDHVLIGTIFHEHLCYHSVHPLDAFLRRHGLELFDVQRVSIQGGSLIGYAQRLGGPRPISPAVAALKQLEEERRLHEPATVRVLGDKLNAISQQTRDLVGNLQAERRRIAGFGAARGGTLIMSLFGLGDALEFLVDDSPEKQGLFSPGHHIPVYPTAALYERRPDDAFILAWVHTRPIIQKHRRFLEEGGRFHTCFPTVGTVTATTPGY
jgi:SAM-dependent methyltransferase